MRAPDILKICGLFVKVAGLRAARLNDRSRDTEGRVGQSDAGQKIMSAMKPGTECVPWIIWWEEEASRQWQKNEWPMEQDWKQDDLGNINVAGEKGRFGHDHDGHHAVGSGLNILEFPVPLAQIEVLRNTQGLPEYAPEGEGHGGKQARVGQK